MGDVTRKSLRARELRGLDLAERFHRQTVKGDGCWTWIGSTIPVGYGMLYGPGGRNLLAHRVSYEILVGPIPAGLWVLHSCDNRLCVNPRHLHLGTAADNTAEAVSRGRMAAGERNGRARLTAEGVAELRSLILAGISRTETARRMGVSRQAVSDIVCGRTWRQVA